MKRILILDDDLDLRILMRRILEQEGFQIADTPSFQEAKEALQTNFFDLLIMQGALPGIDWWELYKSLKADARLGSLRVLILLHKLNHVEERTYQIEKVRSNQDEIMAELPVGRDLMENLRETIHRMFGDNGTALPLGVK